MKQTHSLFKVNGTDYSVPFMLIASLFFLWGFAHSILEVLNPHFQQSLNISKTKASLVQVAVYGGYFLMAIPAGYIVRRWGYRKGVLTGLLLYGLGALLFIPGSAMESFPFYIFSLFVIGCGLTCLETSANPYTTVLGPADSAERRINLAQSLNGVGWIVGPLVGGALLFSGVNIAVPYTIIGVLVLATMITFSRCPLPEIQDADSQGENSEEISQGSLWNMTF
ncbi:MAG: MFS transporter, partial [Paraprevotella sp.]|nr:MFS transporter [Paraprevotella sp.]MDY5266756.1 MFS transporter [Bacteroidaceae bacterium]